MRHQRALEDPFARYVVPELEILLSVARSLTRSQPEAEDLVQDTLLRAFRAIERFDGRHPRAWLLTILRHAHIDRHRRRRPELMQDPDRTLAEVAAACPSRGTPEEFVVGLTFESAIEAALSELPSQFRQALELVDMSGLSHAEAAAVLDIPVGTVMSRVHRARTRIRGSLRAGPLDDSGAVRRPVAAEASAVTEP